MGRLTHGYEITRADRDDIPDLIAVNLASDKLFAGTGLIDDSDLGDHIPSAVFDQAIAARDVFVIRDQSSGKPIGFTLTTERGGTLYLDQISVDPDHGRKGLGRALMDRVVLDARQRRFKRITLSTFADVPWNGPFYRSLGFRPIAKHKYTEWMQALEAEQAASLDVSKRCFMQKRVRLF